MARQKSESRVVPQGRRKAVPTGLGADLAGGGKAVPVDEQTGVQLRLPFDTVEEVGPHGSAADAGQANHQREARPVAQPKSKGKENTTPSPTIERVVDCLERAFQHVKSNKGAPGPDRKTVEEVEQLLPRLLPELASLLRMGTYRPGDIRRVWIPKPGGGQRGLGIPNVVDRVVSEAVRLVLEPIYEPTFHTSSHGFRPKRSCHTAIREAMQYLREGYGWVVDIDLEKYFDRVNHQRLMARLAQRVQDRGLLVLIGKMLKAKVVLPDGMKVSTEEGVPQGGPLSPLLSNIVLDELDHELARRGHRFVRYADDANIYVGSERAGHRVMASVTKFIEGRLRLKVNTAKSAVAQPEDRHFLGFRLRINPETEGPEVLLSKRSRDRLDEKVRLRTPRNWGRSLDDCITGINAYIKGWIGFFWLCSEGTTPQLRTVDAHIRRRLRAIQLKHWKRPKTIAKRLIALGIKPLLAYKRVYEGRKNLWVLSHTAVVDRALNVAYFGNRGLLSVEETWRRARGRQTLAQRGIVEVVNRLATEGSSREVKSVVPTSRM